MNRLTISARLTAGFAFMAVLLTIIAGTSVYALSRLEHDMDAMIDGRMPKLRVISDLRVNVLQCARHMRNALILSDAQKIKAEMNAMHEEEVNRAELFNALGKSVQDDEVEEKRLFAAISASLSTYTGPEEAFVRLVEAGRLDDAKAELLDRARPAQLAYLTALDAMARYQEADARKDGAEAKSDTRFTRLLILAVAIFSLLTAAGVAFVVSRSILLPLRDAVTVANRVANGDLTMPITSVSTDEVGVLLSAMAAMQDNLKVMIGGAKQNADELAAAARQFSEMSAQVAGASQSQSEAAASVAASIEELSVSVSNISESAQAASAKTDESRSLCIDSAGTIKVAGSKVGQISGTINTSAAVVQSLLEQSEAISSIIAVIREVSDQTNLLALNAAIEAARAGEQGRGFAVVADEVRKLAERTQGSTLEISELIGQIQQKTREVFDNMQSCVTEADEGVALSGQAAGAIGRIEDSSHMLVSIVTDISSSLHQQSSASHDIAKQVEHIAQMTEENSAAMVEVNASSARLSELADQLRQNVSRFSV